MASQGPLSAGTTGDDATTGTITWLSIGNPLGASDDTKSTATTFAPPEFTHYLTATNFGFTIPAGAIIEGIVVESERSDGSLQTTDNSILIIRNGTLEGNDHSTGTGWPVADAYRTYGSATDIWTGSFTAAEINAADFGVGFSARLGSVAAAPGMDHVRITVYYSTVAELAPIFELHSHPPPRYWNNQFECLPF